jgi:opacity protein-like surface antigen
MKKIRLIIILIVLIISGIQAKGQQISGAIQLETGFAAGEFREEAGRLILPQVKVNGMYRISNSPFEFGATLGYGRYGSQLTRSKNVMHGVNQNFRIRRNNNLVHLNGVARYIPDLNLGFSPFLEVQAGVIHTFTRSRIRENRTADPLASGTEVYDWSWMYQLGGGVVYPVHQNLFLELSLRYIHTGEMEYLTKSGATYDADGELYMQTIRSPFTMLQPGIGLRYYFD